MDAQTLYQIICFEGQAETLEEQILDAAIAKGIKHFVAEQNRIVNAISAISLIAYHQRLHHDLTQKNSLRAAHAALQNLQRSIDRYERNYQSATPAQIVEQAEELLKQLKSPQEKPQS